MQKSQSFLKDVEPEEPVIAEEGAASTDPIDGSEEEKTELSVEESVISEDVKPEAPVIAEEGAASTDPIDGSEEGAASTDTIDGSEEETTELSVEESVISEDVEPEAPVIVEEGVASTDTIDGSEEETTELSAGRVSRF